MRRLILLAIGFAAALFLGDFTHAQENRKREPRGDLLAIPQVDNKDIICFALYTVHDKTLKLTAQLYPLADDDPKTARLEIEKDGQWVEVAKTDVIEAGWTAPFQVNNWDDTKAHKYRVVHGAEGTYEGTIRKNPVDQDEIIIAGFTGNSIQPVHGGDISQPFVCLTIMMSASPTCGVKAERFRPYPVRPMEGTRSRELMSRK